MYTKPIEDGNGARPISQQDAVMRAMAASRRLIDAATKARNACVEACEESVEAYQETLLGIPGVEETVAPAAPLDWSKLGALPGFLPDNPFGEQLQKALGAPLSADAWIGSAKQAYGEYIDSCEQALLAAIDLRERMGEATNVDWIRSVASTRAGVERDVAKAYVASARRLLK
jgi:hypothetical protein